MKNHIVVVLLFTAWLAFPVEAQFGNLKKKLNPLAEKLNPLAEKLNPLASDESASSETSISRKDLASSLGNSLNAISEARLEFIEANIDFAIALGLKSETVEKLRESKNAIEGASSDAGKRVKSLKDSQVITDAAFKESEKAMEESKELSAESKAAFAEGISHLFAGSVKEKQQIQLTKDLLTQAQSLLKSAGPMEKVGILKYVNPLKTLITFIPGDLKTGLSAFRQATAYGKKQKVVIPDNMEDELPEL
tara:strand:- start:4224 stop:4973 length:750 start_codon:yes stop_codon:yes gene_type:complete